MISRRFAARGPLTTLFVCFSIVLVAPILSGCPGPAIPPAGNGGTTDGDNGGVDDGTGGAGGGSDQTGDDSGGTDSGGSDGGGGGTGSDDGAGDGSGGGTGGAGGGGGGSGGIDGGDSGGDGTGDAGDGGTSAPPPTRIELTRLVQTGDPVPGPGQPDAARFTLFSDPIIDPDGRAAFWATYQNGSGTAGLYVFQNNQTVRILDDNADSRGSLPEGQADEYFGEIQVTADGAGPPFSWGADGRLIFGGNVVANNSAGRPVLRTRGLYRWRASDADLMRVLGMYEFAEVFSDIGRDGSGNPTLTTRFFSPLVNDRGVVLFRTSYVGFTASRSLIQGTGVFATNGVETRALADERLSGRGSVPGQGASATFDEFAERISINPAGDTLMQSAYNGGVGDHGVYSYAATADRPALGIDNSGARFEGIPMGGGVGAEGETFDAIAIGRSGHIAVQTTLTVSGDTRDTVLLRDGAGWRELLSATGVPANGLLSGVNAAGQCLVLADGHPHLTDSDGNSLDLGSALPADFAGRTLEWPATVGAVNAAGRCVIHYVTVTDHGSTRTPGLAFWSGETLLVVADPILTSPEDSVAAITTYAAAGSDFVGRSGPLSDADALVLRIVRPDGSQALYLARALR